ncbi:MAG: DegV family protein [Asgard group archaeon]|nr:DegV family protein [Asgard group archaeon]
MSKAKVKIVSDSTCDLPVEIIEKYNIRIVSANIVFSVDEVRQQYVNITNEEFFHRLETTNVFPKTAIPAPKFFKEAYEEVLEEAEHVITFCVTSKLSGMYSNASIVAKNYFKDTVTVIDTQCATLQMGYVVLEAAIMAANGESKEAILDRVNNFLLPNVWIVGMVPTLKYLQKGGRIGKVASLIGGVLRLKPIIGLEDGVLAPFGRARGFKRGYKALLTLAKNIAGKHLMERVFILHAARPKQAEKLAADFKAIKNTPKDVMILEIGPAIGVHLGPGALGFVWLGEFKKEWLGL